MSTRRKQHDERENGSVWKFARLVGRAAGGGVLITHISSHRTTLNKALWVLMQKSAASERVSEHEHVGSGIKTSKRFNIF